MKWITDPTRRFARRPLYEIEEIENICQDLVKKSFESREKPTEYPLNTSMLSKILEDYADCDFGRDLAEFGEDVEGLTQFAASMRPRVFISSRLREHNLWKRRRMTMAHELGHVHLHNILYQMETSLDLFVDMERKGPTYCKRSTIVRGGDWMEWQASYAAGAILMPTYELRRALEAHDHHPSITPLEYDSLAAEAISVIVAKDFLVSTEAARVRLLQRGVIAPRSAQTLAF